MPSTQEQLKEQVEESIKLTKKMLDGQESLESRIKTIEEKGGGAADLKEQVQKMSQDNAKAIDEIKTLTDKLREEITERQDEFETKFAGGRGGDGAALDVAAPVIKALPGERLGFQQKVKSEIDSVAFVSSQAKAVTSLAASAGDVHVPSYEREIIRPGEQQITLLDVLPQVATDSPLIYWVQEVLGSRTNNAGIQSLDFTGTGQGTALGESDFVFDQKSAETRTYGHTAKIALQMLEDAPQLRGYLENIMRYMVRFDLEDQVLNGDGVGTNFNGLKAQATAYDVTLDAFVTNIQKLDVLRVAILQCALTFFPATASLLHPKDAASIELLKDSQNRYLFVSNPNAGQTIRPWGVPVISTTQQTEDEFTVGAMNQVEVVIRKAIEVLISTENEDDFDKLLATIRAHGRGGLKVYQPGSIIDGDFSVAITGV